MPDSRFHDFWRWLGRPLGRAGAACAILLICTAPAILSFKPLDWLALDPVRDYRLLSDDFRYVGSSRTWGRMVAHLFTPHNTHIVPSWRLTTWLLVVLAGRLTRVPEVLGLASYSILVAVMLLTGRFVARETGRAVIGLMAAALVGTTSLMLIPTLWYSAGQPLWAGFGILAMLHYLQGWRRAGGAWRLVAAAVAAVVAGGFWSIGHVAGPVGAVYLWADGRPRCRRAAAVPLAASLLAVALALAVGGRNIDATVSTNGRTTFQATRPLAGLAHTLQAIPETLVFGNLGLDVRTEPVQGALLTSLLVVVVVVLRRGGVRPTPLECAGGTLMALAYLGVWSFRGYLPFSSLRGMVPWYDAIPHLGFVLLVTGVWAALGRTGQAARGPSPLTRRGVLGVLVVQAVCLMLNRPRVDVQLVSPTTASVPPMTAEEAEHEFPILSLQRIRSVYLIAEKAGRQRRHLARLEQAESATRRLGIGRQAIHEVFGRVAMPELPWVYDAAELLAVPWRGTETDPAVVRRALEPYFRYEPIPRPKWLAPDTPWPTHRPGQRNDD